MSNSLGKSLKKLPTGALHSFFFVVVFAILYFAYIIVSLLVLIYDYPFYQWMESVSTSTLFGSHIMLNYIGFVTPFVISLTLLSLLFVTGKVNLNRKYTSLMILLLVLDTLFSLFVFEPRIITSSGGGQNLPAMVIVLLYVAYLVYSDSTREGFFLSYILGYVIGAISDIESITHATRNTIFGGGGFMDVDFVFPLIIFVSYWMEHYFAMKHR